MHTVGKSVPEWIPWVVAGSLIGLWLFVPPFTLALGPVTLRNIELVRWLPFAIGLIACHRAFFRWHWLDVPVVVYCACPFLAGAVNGLPWADSAWESAKEFSYWWIPFAFGRYLFTTEASRSALGWIVLVAAFLYLPPTLYEVFFGPTLASWATGQDLNAAINYGRRGDTFKPLVFLSSGFVLTMFYVWAVLIAMHRAVRTFWVWLAPPIDRSITIPQPHQWIWPALGAAVLMSVVVLCKSLGSIVLMAIGVGLMLFSRSRLAGVAMAALCLLPPVYIGLRTSGIASTESIAGITAKVTSPQRAGSLRYRLQAEDIVFESMTGHTWWGFGNWGQWAEGRPVMALDGFWLFTWTRTGMVCVIAWLTMVALPVLIVAVFSMRQGWEVTQLAGFPCALFLALSLIDSMFNYFGEPPVMLCVGVVTTWAVELLRGADGTPESRCDGKGVGSQKPERPEGCFAFLTPDPLSVLAGESHRDDA